MKLDLNPGMRYMSAVALYVDIIEQLGNKRRNKSDEIQEGEIDFDWIKEKVSEDVKGPIWNKYVAVMGLSEIKDPAKASNEDVANKLNEIIKALKA